MFGQGEFDYNTHLQGMGVLLEAVATTGAPTGSQNDVQEAVSVVVLHNADQTVAATVPDDAPQQIAGGPDITTLDKERLSAARNISESNKPEHANLNRWQPLSTKPRQKELWQAIMERNSKEKPKNWQVEDMVKYLMKTSPNMQGNQTAPQGNTEEEPQATVVTTMVPVLSSQSPEEQGPRQRWSRNKFARVICIICSDDFKDDFISRDRKLDRQEMDAKGVDSFWEKVACVFNSSKHFDIDRVGFTDKFKSFTAAPSSYVADAAKLKYEFGQMRASLTKALVNFQKSGQGNDKLPDEDSGDTIDDADDNICGSNFSDFCHGDELLEFFEFMLRKTGLVDYATCNMPKDAQFNSSAARRASSSKPKPQKGSKRKKGSDMKGFLAAMKKLPPLKVHKSSAQIAGEKAHAMRQCLKTHMGLDKVLKLHFEKLRTAEQKVCQLKLQEAFDAADTSDASLNNTELQMTSEQVKQYKRIITIITEKQTQLLCDLSSSEGSEEASSPGSSSHNYGASDLDDADDDEEEEEDEVDDDDDDDAM
jgi:hypothetical protein